jgi:hypothetical protein
MNKPLKSSFKVLILRVIEYFYCALKSEIKKKKTKPRPKLSVVLLLILF